MPVILERLRFAQIIFDFLFHLRLRHHRIERWLGIGSLFGPDAVTPVNFLDRSLISYAFCEREVRWDAFTGASGGEKSQQCSGDIEQTADCAEKQNECAGRTSRIEQCVSFSQSEATDAVVVLGEAGERE